MSQTSIQDPLLRSVASRLEQARIQGLWPGGRRDLWTDALGLICLLNLHVETEEAGPLEQAETLALEVDRVLGRRKGICMAEDGEADGQSYRSLALWLFALESLGRFRPRFRRRALGLVREIHAAFVQPGAGITNRMLEDLSGPFPGAAPGTVEVFLGLGVYRLLDPEALAPEIREMEDLAGETWATLAPDQGLDLGLLLWITHFFPTEPWARDLRERCLAALDARWIHPPGYFRRNLPEPLSGPRRANPLALSNLSATIGLQAQGVWAHRVQRVHDYFLNRYSWDESPGDALSPVLVCASLVPGLLLRRHRIHP